MHVVISGASGLIGGALTRSLRADGHRVTALVRRAPEPGADEARWDPAAGTIDDGVLDGVDAVVHLAGAGIGDERLTDERKRLVKDSRVQGTDLLARTMATSGRPPAVFLSGSAMGFYGDRGDEVLTESSAPGDGFLAEVCTAWEAAAQPAIDAGVRTAFLRTSLVLSGRGGALEPMVRLAKLGVLGKIGGDQWWSWITLDDEVRAIRFLLDHDVSGPVNLATGDPRTNAAFTTALGRAVHRPTFLPVPPFAPRLLLGAERADALIFTSARLVPTVLDEAGFTFEHPRLEGALEAVLAAR